MPRNVSHQKQLRHSLPFKVSITNLEALVTTLQDHHCITKNMSFCVLLASITTTVGSNTINIKQQNVRERISKITMPPEKKKPIIKMLVKQIIRSNHECLLYHQCFMFHYSKNTKHTCNTLEADTKPCNKLFIRRHKHMCMVLSHYTHTHTHLMKISYMWQQSTHYLLSQESEVKQFSQKSACAGVSKKIL